MSVRLPVVLLVSLLVVGPAAPSAHAAWVWSPQTGWIGPSGAVKDTPEEQLAFAMSFFDQQDYDRATKEFKKLLNAYKASREAADAQYFLGRCYAEQGDYYRAFKEYRKTIQTYPVTARFNEILERMYEIGNYFLAGNKRMVFGIAAILPARDKAAEIFEAITEDGPFTEHGQLAQYKLGMAHLALKDYEQAVSAFEGLITRYPDSPLVDDARFQIATASLKGTFKPEYDQSPTDQAIKELQAFLETYAQGELADDARERLAQLRELRAEHDYQVAKFYERRGHPESAKLYYDVILDAFPQTAWAPKAAERLQILGGRL